jgi:hypothetical protein
MSAPVSLNATAARLVTTRSRGPLGAKFARGRATRRGAARVHQTCEDLAIRAARRVNEEDSVVRTDILATGTLVFLGTLASLSACASENGSNPSTSIAQTTASCANGSRDGDETGVDCGGSCGLPCPGDPPTESGSPPQPDAGAPDGSLTGVRDGDETDVDCGGPSAPKCAEGKSCLVDSDCDVACNYAKKCITVPSCKPHLGGDTCGTGEVGEPGAQHESCCRSLRVSGYSDPAQPGKTVYLDKYEITAGRIRAFIEQIASANGGSPDVKGWIATHRPAIWDDEWDVFLPTDAEGGTRLIARRLLGDPRPEDNGSTDPPGPGVILPPATDQMRNMGTNYQFGSEIYVDLHGNNCGTYAGSYGFPTFYYPPDILIRDGQLPRADGVTASGQPISAKDLLDVKSMNCITNAMLAAFCEWDGGQLATDEVLDFVTATPPSRGNISGCGTQYDNHGELLGNIFTNTVQTGGRCAPVALVNATFDAGDNLPVPGSPLNLHNYHYPAGSPAHDKAWQISAPGRVSTANGEQVDLVRINPGDEPWADLHGNLNEAALDMTGATFTGKFALKSRGIGYGSSRSALNVGPILGEDIRRIQRPEAKAGYTGGRCMRFK